MRGRPRGACNLARLLRFVFAESGLFLWSGAKLEYHSRGITERQASGGRASVHESLVLRHMKGACATRVVSAKMHEPKKIEST